MNQEKRVILVMASRLLGYPTEDFGKISNEMNDLMDEAIEVESLKEELKKAYVPLSSLSSREIQELYVETFDLKSKLGLYLTAHELGDSTKRGAALIKLQKVINQSGFERVGEELVDYIPMLLEFLAVAPKKPEVERIEKRVSVAISYMLEHVDEANPYARILVMLMKHVFPTPSKEEIKQLESGREEADLEELPYPIMYQ
ncbi:nitrate reductase molybdenum cofactor assembly chaperone [Oceanobacillus bengalensis]|uniref:Nitrate reductase molybdenum cofactor assembly chaperone n=1 Tax=Oceanobacillus bengalensis TaxID=1435466 RepID=A0A494Z4X3_9BACI|nr:nitrate reductase molybdenum cofactor assembly chaperone [Oceanobacillus bengalensis]RKQ17582.1 nitrate reductase molybdenum cofactor assembly chaperone [Oceanobacillus bengalensis]